MSEFLNACALEELSARAMLEGLLPRLLSADVTVRYVVFKGRQDLERQLFFRLRDYQTPDARFIVLRDKYAAEELAKITGRRYQKVGGSRAISPHLDLDNKRSRSFAIFVEGVRRLAAGAIKDFYRYAHITMVRKGRSGGGGG